MEVVSPGKKNINCDYRYKRSQYQARETAEYWIVDPLTRRVTVLTLIDGLYEETTFAKNTTLCSPLLSELAVAGELTAEQVLQVDG